MTLRPVYKVSFRVRFLIASVALAAIVGPIVLGVTISPPLHAQSGTEEWEEIAGGHMEFNVASVKQSARGEQLANSNVPLVSEDTFSPTGGFFSATNYPLLQYIIFAYKLTTSETKSLQNQLPQWAKSEGYDIQARADGAPTKDQYRLMVQSLLQQRFQLAIRFEVKQTPVLALVLSKEGQLGPQLKKHNTDVPCPDGTSAGRGSTPSTIPGGFPNSCGMLTLLNPSAKGHFTGGARDVPMSTIANIVSMSGISGVNKPVIDGTGLSGKYDFLIDFASPDVESGSIASSSDSGPSFIEALKDQLGLKLEPQTAPVEELVIDRVERPTSN